MRYFIAAFLLMINISSAFAAKSPVNGRTQDAKLPVFEYNENYPVYQDYYQKRRSVIFRKEIDSLHKKMDSLTKKFKRSGSASLVSKMSHMQKEINVLKAQNRALSKKLESTTSCDQIVIEGAICRPLYSLF